MEDTQKSGFWGFKIVKRSVGQQPCFCVSKILQFSCLINYSFPPHPLPLPIIMPMTEKPKKTDDRLWTKHCCTQLSRPSATNLFIARNYSDVFRPSADIDFLQPNGERPLQKISLILYYMNIGMNCNIVFILPVSPTDAFTILKPHNQEIGEFFVLQERRATDF